MPIKKKRAETSAALAVIILLSANFLSRPAAADEKGTLYFTFVSSAYYMEKKWGHGMPWDGIRKTAGVAHSNGVPVTWLVNPKSAEEGKGLFKEYHDKYGDAFGYMLTGGEDVEKQWGDESYLYKHLSNKKLTELIKGELDSIKKSLPWADIEIAGGGFRSNRVVKIFEGLGLTGVWGHCWEQTLTDNISDRGAPWGFYYASHDSYKAPARYEGGLVAIEWTARDLNLAFRTGKPETYSTDPNDVGRAGICNADQCDYWISMADQYARNTKYNKIVPFAVHQEAHEMENTTRIKAYNPDDIESAARMLDTLFKYVKKIGAKIVNANDAIGAYRELNKTTPPTYALFSDTLLHKYPDIFIYFDAGGQLFFDRGKTEPLLIRNYTGAPNPDAVDFARVTKMPAAACKETKPGSFSCDIDSGIETAYGLAFWGDYKEIETAGAENPVTKILDGELAYAGFVVKAGKTHIEVTLK
jgi:hypothetical protein